MAHHHHAIVWIDHREARVFSFNADDVDKLVVHPQHPHLHLHHKANSIGDGRAAPDPAYFEQVAKAMDEAGEILLTGPANAKFELKKYIERQMPLLIKKIVGVETVDHPTDGALTDHARRYFAAADRMRPQLAQGPTGR